jgi:hypothetical protein
MSVVPIRAAKALPILVSSVVRVANIVFGARASRKLRYRNAKRPIAVQFLVRFDRHVAFHRLITAVIADAKIAGIAEPTGTNANVVLGFLPSITDISATFRAVA